MSNHEQKRQLIEDELQKNPDISDRQIAEKCGATAPSVSKVRRRLVFNGDITDVTLRLGKDGINRRIVNLGSGSKGLTMTTQHQKTEKQVEQAVATYFERQHFNVHTQFVCEAGKIDILTSNALYEVEYILNKRKLFEALGQVLLYRQALDQEKQAAIVCGGYEDSISKIAKYIQELDVEILCWNDIELIPLSLTSESIQ